MLEVGISLRESSQKSQKTAMAPCDDIELLVRRNFELRLIEFPSFLPSFLVDPDRIKHPDPAGIGAGASRLRPFASSDFFPLAAVFVGFLSLQDFGRYLSELCSCKNRHGIRGSQFLWFLTNSWV
jgi:hypothetical protein